MKSTQLIVWGGILIVIGLAVAGWGGFRSYNDINTWVSARSQIKELEGMTPEKIAEMKKEANASQNPLDMLAGAFLLSPEFVEIAKAQSQGGRRNERSEPEPVCGSPARSCRAFSSAHGQSNAWASQESRVIWRIGSQESTASSRNTSG